MTMPAGWVLCAVLAQAGTQAGQDVTDVERVRKALDAPPTVLTDAVHREGLVFRVTIRALGDNKPPWEDWSPVPTYIRPWWKAQHYEFLEQVTPIEFRTGTLYPVGVPIGPLIEWIAKKMSDGKRKIDKNKARDEVRRELELFLACRADSSKPGC